MATTSTGERSAEPRGFRTVRRLAHACAEAVAARLEPGVTEREAARTRREWLRGRGVNPVRDRLKAHRELILREVRERRPLREIHQDVDRPMVRQGYADRHRAHPFGVIAHRVHRVRRHRWSPQLFGFRTQSLEGLAADAPHGHREGRSPLWSPHRLSDHPPRPGLRAVEPHLGSRVTGAEFEEILVVTDSRDPGQSAFRLDDDLPHTRRWAEEK
ncbi:hypothetical protein GCM10010300_62680 [Streptomyces olivaceoviridis]|uniref:hypothetical protein n=1 Tax=Streptomyces olivaceoviridis TaxID=1921 RepID=UPI0016769437|nr:hypothetical protein [Streptomyces olivaceoviridis]GGZ10130.1 hypothetical protein GCM10010300_62680 [Streptomyces olivaceoviridis]